MSGVNHLAAWIAGIVHFALGAFWYGMLGGAWLAGIGKSESQIKAEYGGSPMPYVTAAVAALVVAYTLAWLLPRLGARSAAMGAVHGFALALALIGSTMAMNYGFEMRPLSLWLINTGYLAIGMAIMGGIIGGWKQKA
jgi:hypothetical protein